MIEQGWLDKKKNDNPRPESTDRLIQAEVRCCVVAKMASAA